MKKLNLNENFISRIWEQKYYWNGLKTTNGEAVEVISYGTKNRDSGADYKDANLRIAGLLYKGDVEIHQTDRDWENHNHKFQGKYNKVILNVAMWRSEKLKFPPSSKSSREIKTVILSEFLTKSIHEIWKDIINSPSPKFKLPCFPDNTNLSGEFKFNVLKVQGMKRLNYRAERMNAKIDEYIHNGYSIKKSELWLQVLFEYTLEALGFSKNKEQFIKLASGIRLRDFSESGMSINKSDALFFGTAGFLNNLKYRDSYIDSLRKEWEILKGKHSVNCLEKDEWNFFRLRPINFPTLRLAFASALFMEFLKGDFFKKVIGVFEYDGNILKSFVSILQKIVVSEYWFSHYDFGKSKWISKNSIGISRITDIVVNVFIPIAYLYSKKFEKPELREKITKFYNHSKTSSKNEVTKVMQKQLQIKAENYAQQQGMINLHNFYCMKGKCEECEIGCQIFVKESGTDYLTIIFY